MDSHPASGSPREPSTEWTPTAAGSDVLLGSLGTNAHPANNKYLKSCVVSLGFIFQLPAIHLTLSLLHFPDVGRLSLNLQDKYGYEFG